MNTTELTLLRAVDDNNSNLMQADVIALIVSSHPSPEKNGTESVCISFQVYHEVT